MKARNVIESFNYAVNGVLHALRTERNMRIHLLLGGLVLILSLVFQLDAIELALVVLTIGMVLAAELLNTAIEAAVDLVTEEYHPLARIAKNVAAGAVFVSAAASVVIAFLLFFDRISTLHPEALARTVDTPVLFVVFGLGLVLTAVIGLKAVRGPFSLQGGMPSGHTALAFALATSIFFLSKNGGAVLLGILIALLVGQSRIESGIHSWIEVSAGAALGILATILVFQILFMQGG